MCYVCMYVYVVFQSVCVCVYVCDDVQKVCVVEPAPHQQ